MVCLSVTSGGQKTGQACVRGQIDSMKFQYLPHEKVRSKLYSTLMVLLIDTTAEFGALKTRTILSNKTAIPLQPICGVGYFIIKSQHLSLL